MLLPHKKIFFKKKKVPELVSLPHFLHDFWRKMFLLYSINWRNFIAWLSLVREILGNLGNFVRYCNCLLTGCDVVNFEIDLIFPIKSFLLHEKNLDKNLLRSFLKNFKYLEKEKNLRWNKKIIHHFKRAFIEAKKTINFFWEVRARLESTCHKMMLN